MVKKVLFGAAALATVSFLFYLLAVIFMDFKGDSTIVEKIQVGCHVTFDYTRDAYVCYAPKTQTILGERGETILLTLCTVWFVLLVMWPMLPSAPVKYRVLRERKWDNTPLMLRTEDIVPPVLGEAQKLLAGAKS